MNFSKEQKEFIKKETGFDLFTTDWGSLPSKDKDKIFDVCFLIEGQECNTDEEVSERGKMAIAIVTLFVPAR